MLLVFLENLIALHPVQNFVFKGTRHWVQQKPGEFPHAIFACSPIFCILVNLYLQIILLTYN